MIRLTALCAVFFINTAFAGESHWINEESYNPNCYGCQKRIQWLVPDRPYKSIGTRDQQKTKECREGTFLPKRHGQYVVRAKGADMNVAWGNGINLFDGKHLSQRDEVYFFVEAGYECGNFMEKGEWDGGSCRINKECEVYVNIDKTTWR